MVALLAAARSAAILRSCLVAVAPEGPCLTSQSCSKAEVEVLVGPILELAGPPYLPTTDDTLGKGWRISLSLPPRGSSARFDGGAEKGAAGL